MDARPRPLFSVISAEKRTRISEPLFRDVPRKQPRPAPAGKDPHDIRSRGCGYVRRVAPSYWRFSTKLSMSLSNSFSIVRFCSIFWTAWMTVE